ncbi:Scr1 family TA system antitoxin-like transcriptional regulator [Streptomyces sp. NPDC001922]|uniref:helix-turn-helix domain-containing protein n=1 Tax=Streptomyces sp. NPDC001922 TaxID=3364624 RepID=UPI0036805765
MGREVSNVKFQSQSLTPDRSARHFYGAEMRRHREAAQLSLVQLAKIVNSSKSGLARVETAELMPPPELSRALDAAFGTDGLFARLYDLAKREAHPDQYRRFMDFEAKATVIENYVAHVVPGTLQTADYARALFRSQPDLSHEQVEERVAARMARQERLKSDSSPHRWAILDESVLRRRIGSRACMYAQLASLLDQAATATSEVQIMPFKSGAHPLLGGSLTILTLTGASAVVYEEGIEAGRLYEDPQAVFKHRRHYDVLRANAHSLTESAALIRSVMEDYQPCAAPPT